MLWSVKKVLSRLRRDPVRTDLSRLAGARFISLAGSDATGIAIGFALYEQTHSAHWLSLSLMLTIGASALLAPFGGKLGDRFDRRRLMISAELTTAALFVGLAFVGSPVALLTIGFLATAIGTVYGPASGAAIAHIAGERHMAWANGVIATGANLGKMAGRAAGGALIGALGAAAVFLLNALTFLVSAVVTRSVRRAFSAPLTQPHPDDADVMTAAPEPTRARGGMRFVLRDRTLRPIVATACVSTFATAFSMTAEIPLVFHHGGGALALGLLTAAWGAGMVVGSWFAGHALHDGNEATGILVGRLVMAAGLGLVGLAPTLAPVFPLYALGGLGGGLMGVAAQSMIMRNTPDEKRSATLGAIESLRNTAFGAGVVGAGTAVTLAGPQPVYALVGLVMALGTLPVFGLVMRLGGPRRLRSVAAAPV
jgi:MFS family permease